jgi:hypothetical protein
MNINTARTQNLRLNRAATHVLDAMRDGQTLHLEFRRTGACWRLSGGKQIDDRVAQLVIINSDVVGDGDALFPDAASQTWHLMIREGD